MIIIKHIKKWNTWRKYNMNGRLHHVLVLFGLANSPTLDLMKGIDA